MANSSLVSTIVILSATLALLTPSSAVNVLSSGEFLYGAQSLIEGSYTLTMQTDCNLVLYDSGNARWSSGTYRKAENCYLAMQYDGNLVIYSGSNALWASNTNNGRANYILVMQRDGNLVVYGPALWASHTNRAGTPRVTIASNSTVSVP